MPSPGAVLVLLAGLAPMQIKGGQAVALPLSEDGVKPPAGLDAWKAVVDELEKRSRRLGLSMDLQKKRHDFLIGPAREQGRDCGADVECLAEIGAALGGDVLVAGTVSRSAVTLYAIDVKSSRRLGKARSPKKLARASAPRKARVAARLLARVLGKLTKEEEEPAVATATPPPAPAPAGKQEQDAPKPQDAKQEDSKQDQPEDLKVDEAPEPPPAAAVLEGRIRIPKEQLTGVSEVTIDGEQIYFSGDGSMTWNGSVGSHVIVAKRNDGNRLTKDVVVEPDETTEVALIFPSAALPPPPQTRVEQQKPEEDGVLGAWWFWTSVGAAVAAGATTAALLAGGAKGGPSIEGNTGTIRGSY